MSRSRLIEASFVDGNRRSKYLAHPYEPIVSKATRIVLACARGSAEQKSDL
jgi:hypothetical protein